MNPRKNVGRIVGALFLISNVVFLTGAFLLVEPILGAPDYLALISAKRAQVVVGALLEFSNAIAYLGIAVLVYPILRQRFPSMALMYVGFRLVEFVMQTLSDLSPLVLLTISEEFVGAGAAEALSLQAIGTLLVAQRAWAFQMVTLALVLGAFLLYPMLYQTKLVPRFISVWGLLGAAAVFVTFLLDVFGLPQGVVGILSILMLSNELFLGGWLIVKGFSPAAALSPVQMEG